MQILDFIRNTNASSTIHKPRVNSHSCYLFRAIMVMAVVGITQPISAATILNNFTGEPISDRTGKNRVKDVLVVKDQGALYLSFEASSMDGGCRLESDSAAWLQLQLTDTLGKSLGGYKNVAIATVGEEGGYKSHDDVDISEKFSSIRIDLATGYRIRMPGHAKCR